MNTPELGKLHQVHLRTIWSDEAGDFTPWLARPENLRELGETLGLSLEPEDEEVPVGPFSADILCKDTADGSWVVIENQIEKTDHRHLGQVLTYAAGLEAKTMVWVAAKFTEEHRAALDWLNENTKDEIAFFGVEIEVWRIGNSTPAPKFNIVSKPNDWSRSVKEVAEGKVSPHKKIQQRFWDAFATYMQANESPLQCTKPLPQHWMNISIGRSGFKLSAVVSAWNSETNQTGPEIRAEVVIFRDGAKRDLDALLKQRGELEKKFGGPLTWHHQEGKNMCRIYTRKDADFRDEDCWGDQCAWLREKLEALNNAFGPAIKQL